MSKRFDKTVKRQICKIIKEMHDHSDDEIAARLEKEGITDTVGNAPTGQMVSNCAGRWGLRAHKRYAQPRPAKVDHTEDESALISLIVSSSLDREKKIKLLQDLM